MTEVRILAVVGMKGAGKSTAVRQLAENGWPKIESGGDTISEIQSLVDAGQRRIVLDGVASWNELVAVRKAYPGQVWAVAIVAPKQVRHKRLRKDAERELDEAEIRECDRIEIEDFGQGVVIAAADEYILNGGEVGELHEKISHY